MIKLSTTKISLICLLTIFTISSCQSEKIDEVIVEVPENITAEEFQREIDLNLISTITNFSEQEWMANIINYYYGEWKDKLTIYLNDATKLKVSKKQFSWLYDTVENLSKGLEISQPVTYVVQNSTPNAYVTNVKEPILVLHSALFKILNRKEIIFVIGHELGHIKCNHILTQEIMSITLYALNKLPAFLRNTLANIALFSILKWSRESEISADRAGLILLSDEEAASKALIKLLSGLSEEITGEIDIQEFLEQKAKAENDAFLLRKISILISEAMSTHPFIGTRVKEILRFKNSKEYKNLYKGKIVNKIYIKINNTEIAGHRF